jgi:acyl carrier protein
MKLEQVLRESFNIESSRVSDETSLMSFEEWDSLSIMFFITKLEGVYGIELTGDEISDMRTIGDIKKIIAAKGKEL